MLLPPGFDGFHCPLLVAASAHHSSGPAEADWIRWTGVAIAVAGALISTPDGTLVAWHWITGAGNWIRDLRDRCARQNIAFFFKQVGGVTPKAGGRDLDGRTWDQMPELADGVW